MPVADVSGFAHAAERFFSSFAALSWGPLLAALALHVANLTLRSRAAFNVLRAAYPTASFPWLRTWGAYTAAYGANAFLPARPGDALRLFLVRGSVPGSSYPTIAATFLVENVWDTAIGLLMLIFALTQGVFPKPPDFGRLGAFELSYLARHPRFGLFALTVVGVLFCVAFALLSARVRMFWSRVRQGLIILRDRRRFLRQVVAWQAGGWLCRFASIWFLLDAFGVGGSVRNVLLVFGVLAVASLIPLAPGGVGVQQALLVKVFAGTAASTTVAAYSVGQQIALAVVTAGVGLSALVVVFRIRSFGDALRQGRRARRVPGDTG